MYSLAGPRKRGFGSGKCVLPRWCVYDGEQADLNIKWNEGGAQEYKIISTLDIRTHVCMSM